MPTPPQRPWTVSPGVQFVLYCLSTALLSGGHALWGAFDKPLSAELGLTPETKAWAAALRVWVSILLLPLAGAVLDRYGARWLVPPSVAVYGVSCGLLGLVAERLAWLVLQGLVAGIATAGMATLWIDTLIVHSFWTGRGWRIGVNTLSAGVGYLCAPLLGVALLVHVGGRLSTLYLGVVLGGLAMVLACFLPPRATLLGTETGQAAVPPAGPLATRPWSAVFSSSPWWQITVVSGLWGLATALGEPWARGALAREPGLFETVEPLMLGLGGMLLAGLVSGVLFGVLADRLGRKTTLMVACLVHAVAYALPLLWPHPLSGALAGLLQGLLVAALVPVLTPLLGEIYGLRHLGTLVGLLAVGRHLSYSLGVWLGTASAAWSGREEGVGLLAAVALGGAAGVSAAIPERRYSVRYRPPAAS